MLGKEPLARIIAWSPGFNIGGINDEPWGAAANLYVGMYIYIMNVPEGARTCFDAKVGGNIKALP